MTAAAPAASAARPDPTARAWIQPAVLVLLLLHGWLAWIARAPGILTSQDDAWYILLARSLRSGSYVDGFLVGSPAHRMYPPGFPLSLAVWSSLGGEHFDWLVLLNVLASVGTLALTYLLFRRAAGSAAALWCVVALVANPSLIDRAGHLESEAVYALAQSVALWALASPASAGYVLLGVAAAVSAALIRSIGATLVLTAALSFLARKQWQALGAFAVAAALAVGGWMVFTATAPEQMQGMSYLADAAAKPAGQSWSAALVDRILDKRYYAADLYWLLPAPTIPGTRLDNAIGAPLAAAAMLAGIAVLALRLPVAAAYLAVYGLLLLLWPYRVPRFLTPLTPLLVACTVVGAGQLAAQLGAARRTSILVTAAVATMLLLAGLPQVIEMVQMNRSCGPTRSVPTPECLTPDQRSFFEAVDHVVRQTPGDAVLLSGKQATVHLYTGRRLVALGRALGQPRASFIEFLRREHVTYVLLLSAMRYGEGRPTDDAWALGDVVELHCGAMAVERVVAPDNVILRLPGPAEAHDGGAACDAVRTYVQIGRAAENRRLAPGP